MKKTYHLLLLLVGLFCIAACTRIGNNPPPPACDNTKRDITITLNWLNATYNCPSGNFFINPPPYPGENYTTEASQKTLTSFNDPFSYLCQISSTNMQNTQIECTNPETDTRYWTTPQVYQVVKAYQNANTNITVDYYDICNFCYVGSKRARPHFVGVFQLPAGANPSVDIAMKWVNNYTDNYCQ